MPSIGFVMFTPEQQQRYRQIGQLAAYDDPELGPILRDEQPAVEAGAPVNNWSWTVTSTYRDDEA
jgi:hypothetical protein